MKDFRHDGASGTEYVLLFSYTFERGDETETVRFVADTDDRSVANRLAYDELEDRVNESQSEWTQKRVGIGFHNPPWNSTDDLMATIRSIDGVRSARFESALEGCYGPPKIHITPASGAADGVVEVVNDYYTSLSIERTGSKIVVIPSALHVMADS